MLVLIRGQSMLVLIRGQSVHVEYRPPRVASVHDHDKVCTSPNAGAGGFASDLIGVDGTSGESLLITVEGRASAPAARGWAAAAGGFMIFFAQFCINISHTHLLAKIILHE